ncbi:MAG: hypothetical protein KF762_12930 [Acidobacteria bacterium]|nr:hypothetical protein [Acidobacteriota bacterium]
MGFVDNDYKKVKPIKQEHKNACWAACLEWWQRANKFGTVYSQSALRKEKDIKAMYNSDSTTGYVHKKSHANYGVLEKHELLSLYRQPRFEMFVYEEPALQPGLFHELLATRGPVIIGYFDSFSNGNHVNVVCGYDLDLQMVEVMEPRKGKFVERGVTEYLGGPEPLVLAYRNRNLWS